MAGGPVRYREEKGAAAGASPTDPKAAAAAAATAAAPATNGAPAAANGAAKPAPKVAAVDGNEATARIAYSMSDVSFIYPITPATPMGEAVDQWATEGRKNVFGNVVQVGRAAARRAWGPHGGRMRVCMHGGPHAAAHAPPWQSPSAALVQPLIPSYPHPLPQPNPQR
jgi:hypothetical protein